MLKNISVVLIDIEKKDTKKKHFATSVSLPVLGSIYFNCNVSSTKNPLLVLPPKKFDMLACKRIL